MGLFCICRYNNVHYIVLTLYVPYALCMFTCHLLLKHFNWVLDVLLFAVMVTGSKVEG